jgi:hypothetical protein
MTTEWQLVTGYSSFTTVDGGLTLCDFGNTVCDGVPIVTNWSEQSDPSTSWNAAATPSTTWTVQ